MATITGTTPGAKEIQICVNDYSVSSSGVKAAVVARRPVDGNGHWDAELPGGTFILRWRAHGIWSSDTIIVPAEGDFSASSLSAQVITSGGSYNGGTEY